MEILELIFGLTQACCCFLEIMAVGTNVSAGVAGVKAHQTRKRRRNAQERGEPAASGFLWLPKPAS